MQLTDTTSFLLILISAPFITFPAIFLIIGLLNGLAAIQDVFRKVSWQYNASFSLAVKSVILITLLTSFNGPLA